VKKDSNLIALGSAAVLAIYATGFVRTKAAAQRFAADDSQRRTIPPKTVTGDMRSAELPPSLQIAAPAESTRVLPPKAARATPAKAPAKAVPKQSQTTAIAPAESIVKAIDSMPVAAPVAPLTPATPTQATDSAEHPADTLRAKYHDGTYSGWGTSRHGDIQAAVEIKNGRIVSAYITQCLTRYSCSRISTIIPQVVERQSAEVDYVSGATQSSDAFYYAVLEALTKAK
jgi:uncharacterized protein with FMN-binding domain